MRKAGRLAPQDWMQSAETRAVIVALTAAGQPARFVGGCVRDALLERPVTDIDIATPEAPDRVSELLESAGVRAVPTGIDHGTITAVTGDAHFEITTLRHDVETFGRRARVAFTDDWEADAARRDFTMNAVFCDIDGTLYDPTGGIADIRAGRVRFVGDPRARIDEDVLRLLRFFRFHAWYGSGVPDADALAACRQAASRLPTLSAERVWSELRRILLAPDPAGAFRLMAEQGVLRHALPEADRIARLDSLAGLERRVGLEADAIRRLVAVVNPGTRADSLAERLRLSRAEKNRISGILGGAGEVSARLAGTDLRRAIYRLGPDLYRDLVLIGWAGSGDDAWEALWRAGRDWPVPRFPLRGADVLDLGIPKGVRVGQLLAEVEDWWVARDFAPDRAACLARLKAAAGRPGG